MAVLLLLSATFSLSSCLDSSDNGPVTQQLYVTVNSLMGSSYFVDNAGNKLIPTPTSLATVATNNKFKIDETYAAFIQFKIIENEQTTKATTGTETKNYNIELLYAVKLDGPVNPIELDDPAEKEIQALLDLNSGYGTPLYLSYFSDCLLMAPRFAYKATDDKFELTLQYLPEDEVEKGEEENLNLRLYYTNESDISTSNTYGQVQKAFHLRPFGITKTMSESDKLKINVYTKNKGQTELAKYTIETVGYKKN